MNRIYLDIETIPSQEPWVSEYAAKTIKPPGTLKKPESIQKWMEEEREGAIKESINKMGFDGSTNHIVCVGVAINDAPPVSFSAVNIGEEAGVLEELYRLTGKTTAIWVGHNISGFDLKIIRQRSIVLGVKLPGNIPFSANPWDLNPFDTMVQWDQRNFIKLDRLARAFGFQGKEGFDGSKEVFDGNQVYQAWLDGLHEEIADYCCADVEMVRAVYKKMSQIS